MDVCALGFKKAAAMFEDGKLEQERDARYAGWNEGEAKKMLEGGYSLEGIEEYVRKGDVNPEPRSGKQERLENLVNRYM
jgi:xylose isomerase